MTRIDTAGYVIVGANVLPMTHVKARADAIAVRDGRIVFVGDEHEAAVAAGPTARRIALPGRAVLPGFIDVHHHMWLSVLYGGYPRLDSARSIAQLLEMVARAARQTAPGDFVVAQGYDPWKLAEQRHPTRAELDDVCPDHPVLVIEYSFHEGAANSWGLSHCDFDVHSAAPQGGTIGRDRRGRLTGYLAETALFGLEATARNAVLARDEDRVLKDFAEYQQRLFSLGITRICDAAVPSSAEALYEQALDAGALQIPVVMMPMSVHGIALPPRDRLGGRPTGEGSDLLKVGPMKLVLDGATKCAFCMSIPQLLATSGSTIGSVLAGRSLAPLRQAWSLNLRIGRDLKVRTGARFYRPADSFDMVRAAYDHGFTVGIHAIGNDAVDQALNAIEASGRGPGGLPPPRIEHAVAISEAQARRAADLGVAVVLQPDFLRLPSFENAPRPPGLRYIAARTLIDRGVTVAASSDAPVIDFDPLDGIRSATGRTMYSGRTCQDSEAIDAAEALCAYTRDAALACGVDDTTGTLEVGKRADLVLLSTDPTALGARLDELCVEATFLGGRQVYPIGDERIGG